MKKEDKELTDWELIHKFDCNKCTDERWAKCQKPTYKLGSTLVNGPLCSHGALKYLLDGMPFSVVWSSRWRWKLSRPLWFYPQTENKEVLKKEREAIHETRIREAV